jgi:hypothetical protein
MLTLATTVVVTLCALAITYWSVRDAISLIKEGVSLDDVVPLIVRFSLLTLVVMCAFGLVHIAATR